MRNFCKISFLDWKSGTGHDYLNCDQLKPISFFWGPFLIQLIKLIIFYKRGFRLEVRNRMQQNDLICDQINTHFIFLRAFSNSIEQIEKLFIKEVFWLYIRFSLLQNDLFCDQMKTHFIFLMGLFLFVWPDWVTFRKKFFDLRSGNDLICDTIIQISSFDYHLYFQNLCALMSTSWELKAKSH